MNKMPKIDPIPESDPSFLDKLIEKYATEKQKTQQEYRQLQEK